MNTRAKVQQITMLSLLQELILASFDSSHLADHNFNTIEAIEDTVPVQRQSITLQVSR